MIITLIAWIYITLLCFTWGEACNRYLFKINATTYTILEAAMISCFTGLAVIATLMGMLSFFFPLRLLFIQLLVIIPTIIYLMIQKRWQQYFYVLKKSIAPMQLQSGILLFVALAVILVMSVCPITHPDTLIYHAPLIRWVEQYKIIKALVQLNFHYGLQSNWFLLCAVFRFSFTGTTALSYVNSTVVAWFLVFVINKIGSRSYGNAALHYFQLLWLLLLAIVFAIYPAVRLTVTSASPDFIVAIYILLIAYLFCAPTSFSLLQKPLIIFLCFFTVTLKPSALPVLLFVALVSWPFNKRNTLVAFISFSMIWLPFLLRNFITSGHLLFPMALPSFLQPSWAYDATSLRMLNNYISSYARIQNTNFNDESGAYMLYTTWLPIWWKTLALTYKITLIGSLMAFGGWVAVMLQTKMMAKRNFIAIIICCVSLVVWFSKAPDPRFALGFIILLPALIFTHPYFSRYFSRWLGSQKTLTVFSVLIIATLSGYLLYRCRYYFDMSNMIWPS
jgi:hypothetical protein